MIEVIKKVEYGSTFYYIKGTSMFHRDDGPAIIYDNGDKYWYVKGKRHRLDGPAIEFDSGSKSWYCNGKLHREDGPAQDWGSKKRWALNGVTYTKEEWFKALNEEQKAKALYSEYFIRD